MNRRILRYAFIILIFGFLFSTAAKNTFAQNSLNGLIFNRNRNPVANIDVELLDEFERFIRSVKTSSAGIYIFQGLRGGIYFVQVRVDGTNYKSVKERIQIGQSNFTNSTTGGISGAENLQLNFVLEFDRRGIKNDTPINNEIVFAQNIPEEAKKFYNNALNDIDKKNQPEAISKLEKAIGIFPDYFLALDKLGYQFISLNKFAEAEDIFTKAVKINPKSFSSKSGLGISQFKLDKKSDAAKTIEEALVINPSSATSFLFLGKIYRDLKDYEKAETNFKKAAELSKNKLPDVHWELALLYYYNLNRYTDAANELELFLKANPNAENKKQVEKLIKSFREKAKQKS